MPIITIFRGSYFEHCCMTEIWCEVPGFRCCAVDILALLGCYSTLVCLISTFQGRMSIQFCEISSGKYPNLITERIHVISQAVSGRPLTTEGRV